MGSMLDCSSCGGPFPEGRRCCPHCHCSYSGHKRAALAIAAAVGLGGAGCLDKDNPSGDMAVAPQPLYGPFIGDLDLPKDLGSKD